MSLLLEKGIPHNVVMVKGPPFSYHQQPSPPPGEDQETVIRVIVVPRKAAYGEKKLASEYVHTTHTLELPFCCRTQEGARVKTKPTVLCGGV